MKDLDKDRQAYRETVIGFLIMNHNWDEQKASYWMSRNFDYVEAMWQSSCPPEQVASYINDMKRTT